MTTPTPGWYPDPQRPDLVRWFDGTAWTGHVQAAQSGPQQPTKRPWSGRTIALVSVASVLGAVVVLGGLAALAVPVAQNQRDRTMFEETVRGASCEQVMTDEVRLAAESAEPGGVGLVTIDEVRVVEDHLATAQRPAEGAEEHLLTCEGMARWADGSRTPLRLTLTIDSDNQMWIDDTWDESSTGSA